MFRDVVRAVPDDDPPPGPDDEKVPQRIHRVRLAGRLRNGGLVLTDASADQRVQPRG